MYIWRKLAPVNSLLWVIMLNSLLYVFYFNHSFQLLRAVAESNFLPCFQIMIMLPRAPTVGTFIGTLKVTRYQHSSHPRALDLILERWQKIWRNCPIAQFHFKININCELEKRIYVTQCPSRCPGSPLPPRVLLVASCQKIPFPSFLSHTILQIPAS